jgi:adenylate cyclase
MNQLLAELRRRNVFRVAAAYLVVGWIVMQVAMALETSLGLPPWFDSLITALLILGLPIALLLAWAFEMTPDGMRKTADAPDDAGFRPLGPTDYALLGGLALVLVAIIAQSLFVPRTAAPAETTTEMADASSDITGNASTEIAAGPAENSIAVLAFEDLSSSGDQAYFSDGIAEEILNVLVRVDGLAVTSRTSAFQFRGQDVGIPEIAERLNVRHIVEGSVRKAGDTLRITAQLIDTETDVHLWSQTYDRPLTAENVFEIQDDIAGAIVAELRTAFGLTGLAEVEVSAATANLDAYELYLRGQALFHQRNSQNIVELTDLFEQAVEADPDFAPGWAALAMAYAVLPSWSDAVEVTSWERAEAAADRASALDDTLALPYSARGSVAADLLDWGRAVQQHQLAVEGAPRSAQAHYMQGQTWLELGFFDRSIDAYERSLALDPHYHIARRYLAHALVFSGDADRGLAEFETSLLNGQTSHSWDFAHVYAALGNPAAARLLIIAGNLMWNEGTEYAYLAEPMVAWMTDPDLNYRDSLDARRTAHQRAPRTHTLADIQPPSYEASLTRFNSRQNLFWNPYLADRRRPATLERFRAFRRQLMIDARLPEYWHEHGFPPQCRAIPASDGGPDDFECDMEALP